MIDQLPVIIVLAPLFGALLVGLIGAKNHSACPPIAFSVLLISLISTIVTAMMVSSGGPIDYYVGGWGAGKMIEGVEIPRGFGIQLRVDQLNSLVLVVIGIVVLLVSIFAIRRQGSEDTEKTHYFYALFLMLCCGLFGMTITADAFNLFVLIEVSSLTSYGLIAMGSSPRGTVAAFNYIIMGTVGASFYLLGVGYLYLKTGTLNMIAIHEIINLGSETGEAIYMSRTIMVAFILILIGMWIKMAFFPLYGWLPNAYSFCPSSTSCVLAPLMTKVSVYVMIRMMITVFGLEWVFGHFDWSHIIVWLAVIAIIAGSLFALAQTHLKKMLCYLIVAEVGYMVGGAWLADTERWGLTGSIYHILADALMTLCLFLAAGIFARQRDIRKLEDLDGLFKKMPLTMIGLVVGALAMIGVPPTCGFFSKFYLIRGGIEAGHWEYVVALLVSSLVNAVLFFRIFEIAYFGKKPSDGHGAHDGEEGGGPYPVQSGTVQGTVKSGEGGITALLPLWVTAVLIVALGLMNGQVVEFIRETAGLITDFTAIVD
ncbi:MAG: monovalent cation/H+ antiporter subunit D family protein [Verrucomicrobiales bacterium]|nr:monovalent cation/H+ antiporter subunit D family protein [Verrucomicrobiales bacterium]